MTDPIHKPVRWETRFRADGVVNDGSYIVELVGYGKTPEHARASAATNLDRVKARLLVASIEFGSHRVLEAQDAGKAIG